MICNQMRRGELRAPCEFPSAALSGTIQGSRGNKDGEMKIRPSAFAIAGQVVQQKAEPKL